MMIEFPKVNSKLLGTVVHDTAEGVYYYFDSEQMQQVSDAVDLDDGEELPSDNIPTDDRDAVQDFLDSEE